MIKLEAHLIMYHSPDLFKYNLRSIKSPLILRTYMLIVLRCVQCKTLTHYTGTVTVGVVPFNPFISPK